MGLLDNSWTLPPRWFPPLLRGESKSFGSDFFEIRVMPLLLLEAVGEDFPEVSDEKKRLMGAEAVIWGGKKSGSQGHKKFIYKQKGWHWNKIVKGTQICMKKSVLITKKTVIWW